MKKLILIVLSLSSLMFAKAQTITNARFWLSENAQSFRLIELEINNLYRFAFDGKGEIKYIESLSGDEIFEDDCRNIGLPIEYYSRFDIHDIPNRVKSIGGIKITYNNSFDIHDKKGSLKSVGDIQIKYYNTFDIHDPQGKVKSVENVSIKYYNKFDSDRKFGDIKSVSGNSSLIKVIANRRNRDFAQENSCNCNCCAH